MTPKPEWIITDEGFVDLDKYFTMHKDPIMRIAWKKFKDKAIRPYAPEGDPK